jgi:hypothetical protein
MSEALSGGRRSFLTRQERFAEPSPRATPVELHPITHRPPAPIPGVVLTSSVSPHGVRFERALPDGRRLAFASD